MARTRIAQVKTVWTEDDANRWLEDGWDLLGVFPHPTAEQDVYYVLVHRKVERD